MTEVEIFVPGFPLAGVRIPKPPGAKANCSRCGRWCFWRGDIGTFQCAQASYDSHADQWEHE